MIKALFDFSVYAVIGSFLGIVAWSIIGGYLERKIKDPVTISKMTKFSNVLSFTLFLILGFSIVPVVVGIFIPLLQKVVPVNIDIISNNDMLIVFAFWAVYIIGLVIMLPVMIKEGFFEPEKKQEPRPSSEKQPGLTWPPLDYQIKEAGAIMLATTEKKGDSVSYTVLEIWKQPQKGFLFKKGEVADIPTKFFELQGYTPVDRQLVVFFTTKIAPYNDPMELLPVIGSYVMYAPSDTTVQEYLPLGDLKKRVMQAGKQ